MIIIIINIQSLKISLNNLHFQVHLKKETESTHKKDDVKIIYAQNLLANCQVNNKETASSIKLMWYFKEERPQ